MLASTDSVGRRFPLTLACVGADSGAVAWPAGFNQMPGVDTTPNSVTVITAFVSQDGATVYGLGTEAITGSVTTVPEV